MSQSTLSSTSTFTTTLTTHFATYNRGPITSLFQPPTTCYATSTSATNGALFVGHINGYFFDPACYPTGSVGSNYLETTSNWGVYYYSPAICPSGWTTAATFTSTFLGQGTLLTEAIILGSATSAFACCPSEFNYVSIGHACTSKALPHVGETISYIYPTPEGTLIARGNVTIRSVDVAITVRCDGIPIWWQASDQAVLAAASTMTSTASPTSTATNLQSTSTSTSTGASTASPTSSPLGGLSTGAKAAIGVVIPVVLIAIVFGVFWFFRTRRKRVGETHQGVQYALPGTHGNGPGEHHGYELDNERPVEIYTEGGQYHQPYKIAELASQPI